jgi:hypothetical protein
MKQTRIMMLAMLVALAACAALATSASAVTKPEFEIGHSYTMLLQGSEPLSIEIEGGEKITCPEGAMASTIAEGDFLGLTKRALIDALTLVKCENKNAEKCKNVAGEEILTEQLEGELGYLTTESKLGATKVALTIKREESHGPLIAKFECGTGPTKYEMQGCVIGELAEAANKLEETYSFLFEQAGGTQKLVEYEPELGKANKTCTGLEVKVGSSEFKKSGLSLSARIDVGGCPHMERIKD